MSHPKSYPKPGTGASTRSRRSGNVSRALAADRLGVPSVVFFVMSAATPLTVVAGVVTTGYAVTGITGMPVAFVVIGVGARAVLRRVRVHGSARRQRRARSTPTSPAGSVARSASPGRGWRWSPTTRCRSGLYGADRCRRDTAAERVVRHRRGVVGRRARAPGPSSRSSGCSTSMSTAGCWPCCWSPRSRSSWSTASPTSPTLPAAPSRSTPSTLPRWSRPGVGAILALGVLGFVGFEGAVVYSEEARDPHRTVRIASYVLSGVIAGLYTLSSWAMSVATGPDQIVAAVPDATAPS